MTLLRWRGLENDMRVGNIEVTIKMPLPVDKPDLHGCIYSKAALKNAFNKVENSPLCIENITGELIPIGAIQSSKYVEDEAGDYAYLTANVFYGGTCEDVICNDRMVVDMRVSSVGIGE